MHVVYSYLDSTGGAFPHLLYNTPPFATVQHSRIRGRMHCPTCQNDLIEIPTFEGPELDVCPGQHGLWLDAGEVTLFVDNYRALKEALPPAASPSDGSRSSICPRCGGLLNQKSVLKAALFACPACRGWWLPQGSLTQLNETSRGAAAPIRLNESEFYTRAEKRRAAASQKESRADSRRAHVGRRAQDLWFWTIFLGGVFLLACLILFAGIRKTLGPVQWEAAPDATLLHLVLGAGIGLGLSIYGLIVNHRKALIESIPTSPIRSLAVGLVEVSGRAQPERELLRAPFTGMPCVFFSYTVEERHESRNGTKWETIARGTSEAPFFVQDLTGKVLVVPFDAQLMLPDNRTTRSNWSGTLPAETIRGLLTLGIPVDGWFGEKTIRCSEASILPEETVYVLGTAQENKSAADSTENPARLYIGSSRDHEFIISDRSEKELLSRLRWQVFAYLGGGPALAVLCLLLIFKTYGIAVP
jgi:Zn-finger nucleic acid-binding protein